jgi:hypothetical protein
MTEIMDSYALSKLDEANRKIHDGINHITMYHALLDHVICLIDSKKVETPIVFCEDHNLGIINDESLESLYEALRKIDKGICLLRQINAERILKK